MIMADAAPSTVQHVRLLHGCCCCRKHFMSWNCALSSVVQSECEVNTHFSAYAANTLGWYTPGFYWFLLPSGNNNKKKNLLYFFSSYHNCISTAEPLSLSLCCWYSQMNALQSPSSWVPIDSHLMIIITTPRFRSAPGYDSTLMVNEPNLLFIS